MLLDTAGAFCSAAAIGGLFATGVLPTGLPLSKILFLAVFAVAIATQGCIDATSRVATSTRLKITATLNVVYGSVTVFILWQNRDALTTLAWIYFPCEIAFIAVLVVIEIMQVLKDSRQADDLSS